MSEPHASRAPSHVKWLPASFAVSGSRAGAAPGHRAGASGTATVGGSGEAGSPIGRSTTSPATIGRVTARSIIRLAPILAAVTCVPLAASASREQQGLANFQTPSRNIVCSLSFGYGNSVVCWVLSARCNHPLAGRVGEAWRFEVRGRVARFCPGDFQPPAFTLRYGRSITRGKIRCTSRRVGLTCRSLTTGRGFFLSRERRVALK